MGFPVQRYIPTRRLVGFGLFLLAAPVAARTPCPPPRVLFVCPVGTVKSAIAREQLKRRAAQRSVAVEVASRGVHPADHVSPALAGRLKADGIDTLAEPVRALSAEDIAHADIVIAFDEAAQAPGMERARVWDVPSWNEAYAEAKAALAPRIEALLDELARRGCPG